MRNHPLRPNLVLALACLLALLLFLMGIVLPQARLWGSFLVPIVIVFLWGRRRDIYVVAALASVLLAAAYWAKHGATLGAFLSYQLLSLAILCGVAWLLAQRRLAHEQLLRREQELDEDVQVRAAALADSEERYRALFDHAADGIYSVDATGHYVEVNDGFCRMLGRTRAEIIGAHISEMTEDITPEFFAAVGEELVRHGSATFERRLRRADGSLPEVEVLVTALSGGQRMAVVRDISQRKAAERALLASEDRFARLFNSSPVGIALTRLADGTFLEANDAYAGMVGWDHAALIGHTSLELGIVNPADRQRLTALLQEQGHLRGLDLVLHTKGGDELNTLYAIELIDVAGEPCTLVSVVDITVRKQLEDALAASERKYRDLYDNSPAMYMSGYPADHIIRDCNLTLARTLGYPREELIGQPSHIVFTPASYNHMLGQLPQYIAAGEYANCEVQLQRKDGTVLEALMSGQLDPATADRPAYSRITLHDITARKQAEAAIKVALAHEKELGELKSRIVSMASHEFRNPLAAILTTAEVLALQWERLDKEKIDHRLNRIREQVLRLTAITEDVLQLTRLQAGHNKFEPVPGDLDALCGSVLRDLSELPGYSDRICYDCALHPLPAIFDARLLQQALTNLVHNALKYSPSEKNVHITAAQTGKQITLQIADEGIGIPPEDLPHLFEPFHRAGNVGAIHGTGLGLAIAKEAIELHGGTIAVESRVDVGTVFIVSLPASMESAY